MKLNADDIKKIVTGAVRVEEKEGAVKLFRFTKEQEELYKERSADFYQKTFSTAGMKLLFLTDSKSLSFDIKTERGSSRSYFSFDVFVDGVFLGSLDNYSHKKLPENYLSFDFGYGDYSKSFYLGDGIKTVCVYLPWSVSVSFYDIFLDDGAFFEEIKPKKKLLAFGDSITQGYDALKPSNRYISKLADKLEAEEINKAIGGERFFPGLSKLKDSFFPDYITVAYGTNDWNNIDEETFNINCREFYFDIRKNYPDSEIFAITPIWRLEMNEKRPFGAFEKVEENIRKIADDIGNIKVISGFDFVPGDAKYFADLRLHPNDEGFELYFKNLYKKIEK